MLGQDYWWNLVTELEAQKEQTETQFPNVGKADDETYEEYVLVVTLLGPLYKYLTEGKL